MIAATNTETVDQYRCERCHRLPGLASAHDCPDCSMRLLDRLLPAMGEPATVIPFPRRSPID